MSVCRAPTEWLASRVATTSIWLANLGTEVAMVGDSRMSPRTQTSGWMLPRALSVVMVASLSLFSPSETWDTLGTGQTLWASMLMTFRPPSDGQRRS